MKKVGILTFHRANNYGAVLQAYAFKHVLTSLGYNVQIINYLCPKIEDYYSFFCGSFSFSWLIRKMVKILFLPRIISNNKKFQKFRDKYLIDMGPVLPGNIDKINQDFDIFISGSDQVFNPRLTGFDKNYLLNFVQDNKKKYSYAASVGLNNYTPLERDFLKENLQGFAGLSLREREASDFIGKLLERPVFTHLDPTLLLNKQEWQKVACMRCEQEKYILVYLMEVNPKIISFTEKLAAYTKLKVINLTAEFINKTPFRAICVSPEKYLGYFLGAEYIVTNSFHGLVFAMNFNKKFFVDFLRKSGNNSRNSRVEYLLNLTKLKNRLIDDVNMNYDEDIAFEVVNRILKDESDRSMYYLRNLNKLEEERQ